MSNSSTTTETSRMPDVVVDAPTPGQILREEFLEPLGVSQYRLAKEIGVSQAQVSTVIKGQRSISADMSVRLSVYFGISPTFFANLQVIRNTRLAQAALRDVSIRPLAA